MAAKGVTMIYRLESLSDSRLDAYARLTEAQLRNKIEPEKGIFIAESFKVIERALDAGYITESLLMEEKWLPASADIIARLPEDTPMFVLPSDEIKQLTGFKLTRGILAAMRRPQLPPAKELLRDASRIAILEGLVDHTNVGALFRSAAALNVDAVLVTPNCCDPLYRRSVRVSMGTIFQIPWSRLGDSAQDWPHGGMQLLKDCGFSIAAFALSEDAISLGDPRLADCEKLALIFGNEGDGLSPQTVADADFVVKIPMRNGVDSLNVAAASAVVFWELCN